MRILRANKDSLRSVLETFLHDPLVEWVYVSKKVRSDSQLVPCSSCSSSAPLTQRDTAGPDQTKARALEALEPISNKLLGLQVTSDPESVGAKEVAVEEQVERLIREARDPKNLGSMYVGVRDTSSSSDSCSTDRWARRLSSGARGTSEFRLTCAPFPP